MKRIISLSLALLLTFGLLSVGAAEAVPKKNVTIRVLSPGNIQSFYEGENENNSDIHTFLEEFTGYTLEYQILPSEGAEEKMNLMMASGDAPDFIRLSRSNFLNYYSEGLLQPLTQYIDNSPTLAGTDCLLPEVRAMATLGGEEYAVCTPTNGSTASISLSGKARNLADIDVSDMSLEGVKNILLAVQEKFPDVVTFTAAGASTNSYKLHGFEFIYGAFNLDTLWREAQGGGVEMSSTTEDMRDCLAYLADLYQLGLIDPEYVVTKPEKLQEKLYSDKTIMAGVGWYEWQSSMETLYDEDGAPMWKYLGNAIGQDGMSGQDIGSPVTAYCAVPYNSKIPQDVVDYIGYLCAPEVYDFMFYGVEGLDYEWDANGERVKLEGRRTVTGTQYFVYYYIYENVAQRTDRLAFNYRNDRGQTERHIHYPALKNKLNPALAMPPNEFITEKMPLINDLSAQYFLKILTGALPVEAFDQYLQEFDALGGNEVVEIVNAWYNGL